MATESLLIKRVLKIEQHSLVKQSKGLQKQLAGLKNQIRHHEKVSSQYAHVVELMADGVEYMEAEIIAGLRKSD